ncbi:MAG: glycosyltransferase [Bacteroidetes bacterium]|nr:glycosyltransferase [Bacteroidota bacterium]
MKLSIILPSYKSAVLLREQLPAFKKWLSEKFPSNEIIVVDDGSGDGGETEKVVLQNNCTFIGLKKNTGKGGAVRAGMKIATGDVRIFTDADVPFEFETIERFVQYLTEKEFHIVIGDRRLPESKYFSEIKGMRKLGSRIFTFIVGRFITTGMFDTQCGIKGFRAKTADDLFLVSRLNSFTFDVELLYIALKRNYDIKKLPVHFRSSDDHSSVSLMRHAPGMLVDLFRIKWNHVRGKYDKAKKSDK